MSTCSSIFALGVAVNRFGLGARPDDVLPADARRWLLDQAMGFDPKPAVIAAAATSTAVAAEIADYLKKRRAAPTGPDSAKTTGPAAGSPTFSQRKVDDPRGETFLSFRRRLDEHYAAAVAARAGAAFTTEAPFIERLVHFWSNHFAVSADKLTVVALAGSLEFEAIRPHVLGRFGDMLNAAERHPSMLLYLDQAVSVGPQSPRGRGAARGGRNVGLNENLAREIMELHTLGVRGGFNQADVTEFARTMTGWTVTRLGRDGAAQIAGIDSRPGQFVFVPALHEPGERTIMGKRYPDGGEAQAQAVLQDLATHPSTADHLATKLARHFAGDAPPAPMVERLRRAFLTSGGDLPTVYRAIVDSPEAWAPAPVKFKTPWEWACSAFRAVGVDDVAPAAIVALMKQLGQPVWRPGQPAGYDDIAGSWAAPAAVLRRVQVAERFAARVPATIDARALAPKLFPGSLGAATAEALTRAASPGQALTLLLVAPEMMRR